MDGPDFSSETETGALPLTIAAAGMVDTVGSTGIPGRIHHRLSARPSTLSG